MAYIIPVDDNKLNRDLLSQLLMRGGEAVAGAVHERPGRPGR
jgi:CheY-like chemotaxis protein